MASLPANYSGSAARGGRPSPAKSDMRPFVKPDYSSIKHSSTIKLLSVVKPGTEVNTQPTGVGLTKGELIPYINDPFWVRVRTTLFVLLSCSFFAMFIASVAIVATEVTEPCRWNNTKDVLFDTNSNVSAG